MDVAWLCTLREDGRRANAQRRGGLVRPGAGVCGSSVLIAATSSVKQEARLSVENEE